jgi:hypothetical protein
VEGFEHHSKGGEGVFVIELHRSGAIWQSSRSILWLPTVLVAAAAVGVSSSWIFVRVSGWTSSLFRFFLFSFVRHV